jgi:hypothetical protein
MMERQVAWRKPDRVQAAFCLDQAKGTVDEGRNLVEGNALHLYNYSRSSKPLIFREEAP